jgi:hypothetical protein
MLLSSSRTTRILHSTALQAGPFFGPEEEFDCPDEEECEIDWDLMPGFGDDEDEATEEDVPGSDTNDDDSGEDQAVEQSQDRSKSTFGAQVEVDLQKTFEKRRVRMEMNWQIDECATDEDSCADYCLDCAGGGVQACRFCRGTNMIALKGDFQACVICNTKGQEDCVSCRGTGRIAPWAVTMNDHLNHSKPL